MFFLIIIILLFTCLGVVAVRTTQEELTKGWMLELNTSLQKCYFTGGLVDNFRNTYKSSMAEHLINNHDCAEKFSADFFLVLSNSHSSFHLKVLETMFCLADYL